MDSPSRTLTLSPPQQPPSQHLLTTTTRRRSSRDSANSPEFEFEFSKTGCNSQTTLHSADELFSDGFLLPLQFLNIHRSDYYPEPDTGPFEDEPGLYEPGSVEPDSVEPDCEPSALITSSGSSNSILSASKRWREIFKRADKKPGNNCGEKPENTGKLENRREKERKKSNNNNGNNSSELNINIWPFSRSRSAGNNSSRSRPAVQSNRKISSAPCSRSNSSGESKSRKSWPSSPGRTGVHLGRTSPVWHVKKPGSNRVMASGGGSGHKNRVLKLNVPVCIGYRQSLSCQSTSASVGGGDGGKDGGDGGGNGNNGNLFSLRGLFSRKNSTTVLTV